MEVSLTGVSGLPILLNQYQRTKKLILTITYVGTKREETGLDAVDIVVKVQVPGAMGVFNHTYELQELDTEQVQALTQSAEDEKENRRPGLPCRRGIRRTI